MRILGMIPPLLFIYTLLSIIYTHFNELFIDSSEEMSATIIAPIAPLKKILLQTFFSFLS
jgi:hypothetical protein